MRRVELWHLGEFTVSSVKSGCMCVDRLRQPCRLDYTFDGIVYEARLPPSLLLCLVLILHAAAPFLDLSLHARSGLQTVLAFSVIVHMCVMMMPGAKDHMMNSVNAYVCRISYADG